MEYSDVREDRAGGHTPLLRAAAIAVMLSAGLLSVPPILFVVLDQDLKEMAREIALGHVDYHWDPSLPLVVALALVLLSAAIAFPWGYLARAFHRSPGTEEPHRPADRVGPSLRRVHVGHLPLLLILAYTLALPAALTAEFLMFNDDITYVAARKLDGTVPYSWPGDQRYCAFGPGSILRCD